MNEEHTQKHFNIGIINTKIHYREEDVKTLKNITQICVNGYDKHVTKLCPKEMNHTVQKHDI